MVNTVVYFKMSDYKASQSLNLPQLQNLIKRDPESYRDEVCVFSLFRMCLSSNHFAHVCSDCYNFFFTNRVVNIWNSLPDYVVHADTVNCFKSRLSGLIKIWYITSKPKLAEPEVEVKLYSKYYNNTLY